MLLSDSLVCALDSYDVSGIKVFCDQSKREEISNYFIEKYNVLWLEALQKTEEKYGNVEKTKLPAKVTLEDYGFFVVLGALETRYSYGDFYDYDFGFNAFDKAIKEMKAKYPDIEYEGYIGYVLADTKSGEPIQINVFSKNVELYDFVGEKLGKLLASEEYCPEEPKEMDELNFVVAGKLTCFENREEFVEYIEDLGGNVTGGVSKKTNYLICNDITATSAKNIKAKELDVPIITEKEFIAMFGEIEEFDIEPSHFWTELALNLETCGDYKETIANLYAYKTWINEAYLKHAIDIILDIAMTQDEDVDALKEYIKTL